MEEGIIQDVMWSGSMLDKAVRTRLGTKNMYSSSSNRITKLRASTFKINSAWLVEKVRYRLPVIPRATATNRRGSTTKRTRANRRRWLNVTNRVTTVTLLSLSSKFPAALVTIMFVVSPRGADPSASMNFQVSVTSAIVRTRNFSDLGQASLVWLQCAAHQTVHRPPLSSTCV